MVSRSSCMIINVQVLERTFTSGRTFTTRTDDLSMISAEDKKYVAVWGEDYPHFLAKKSTWLRYRRFLGLRKWRYMPWAGQVSAT